MNPDFTRIRAKFDHLLSRDDIALPASVYERWDPQGLREALEDESRAPADRLLDALAGRTMGVLRFRTAAERYELVLDEFETGYPTDQSWICIGESEMATTTAILVHSRTGETALYDSDAWDWGFPNTLVLVKDSIDAFVDQVVLGSDYRLLYYQNWVEQMAVVDLDDLEFPGVYCDPWYLYLRELRADRFGGQAVPRSRRAELLHRIDAYHEWEPEEAALPLLRRSAPFEEDAPWGDADNTVAMPLAQWRNDFAAPAAAWPGSGLLPVDLSIAFTAYLDGEREPFAPVTAGAAAYPVLGRPPGLEPHLFVLDPGTGAVHRHDAATGSLEPVNASLALFHRFLRRFARFAAQDEGEETRPERAALLEDELKALDPVGFSGRDLHWSLVFRILRRTLAD
ncbi:SUKH-4 family immunity protein [Glycomyces paridis]|uniref:Uncharacterized protein n=1 Tax=Glycomyces paridis TaxID=2126555 RepID=A0A4S8PF57_9ACTN|nr:SUKH-4 family immunity protein [Glycomyces paridis]THV29058.1 hypothetical protein E9998_09950 [Glycomyces paridis]